MPTTTIDDVLAFARRDLSEAGIPDPAREAASLLQYILAKPRAYLIAHPEQDLTADEAAAFARAINRRSGREPLQYITGRQEFFGLEFEITPDVLIPRPETEILVEAAIAMLRDIESPTFLDIGTGSGCIPVAVLHNVQKAVGTAVDVSPEALAVARRNAEKHNVIDHLDLVESDLLTNIDRRFDLITSNPPYIPAADIPELQPEVRDFEPHRALDGGPDGLDIIRRIVDKAPQYLHPRGRLLLEIGIDEADAVSALFESGKWVPPDLIPDLQGIPRVVKARLKSS